MNVNGTTIMWGVPIFTVRTIEANRPDIIVALHNKEKNTCLPIDSNCQNTVNFWLFKHIYKGQYENRPLSLEAVTEPRNSDLP
jgi:hypothetical protein